MINFSWHGLYVLLVFRYLALHGHAASEVPNLSRGKANKKVSSTIISSVMQYNTDTGSD